MERCERSDRELSIITGAAGRRSLVTRVVPARARYVVKGKKGRSSTSPPNARPSLRANFVIIFMHYIVVLRYIGHYVCTGMYVHPVLGCSSMYRYPPRILCGECRGAFPGSPRDDLPRPRIMNLVSLITLIRRKRPDRAFSFSSSLYVSISVSFRLCLFHSLFRRS